MPALRVQIPQVLQGDHVTPEIPNIEDGWKFNVAFGLPSGWRGDAAAELSLADFVRFYATEFSWGRECVSVRTGDRNDVRGYDSCFSEPGSQAGFESCFFLK